MKKLFKKSIACLIAVLMVVSTMPFSAITAQAADGYEVLGKVTIDPIIYTHGTYSGTTDSEYAYMNYGSTIADGSYDGECKTAVSSTLTISSVEAVGVSGASLRVENDVLKGTLGSAYEGSGNADTTVTLKFTFSNGTYEYHKMPVKTNPVAQHVAGFAQRWTIGGTWKRALAVESLAVGSYGQTNSGSYSATKTNTIGASATHNYKKMYVPFNSDTNVGAYCTDKKFYGFIDNAITTDKQNGYAAIANGNNVNNVLTVNSLAAKYYIDLSSSKNYGIVQSNGGYYIDILVGKIYDNFNKDCSVRLDGRSATGLTESSLIGIVNSIETTVDNGTDRRGYIRYKIDNPTADSTIDATTYISYRSDNNTYAQVKLNLPINIQITDKSTTRNLYNNYISNLDPRCYTADSWATFRDKLLTAEEFLNDNTDNSSDATAKSNLENARNALVVNSDSSAHNHYTDTITKQATCTENGSTKRTCTCGYSYTDNTIPAATGHTEVIDKAVEPTCTKTGLTEGKHCSVCNTVLVEQTEIPATGVHTQGEAVRENENPATCTTDGSYDLVVRCTVCDEILSRETKTIDKLGHSYTSVVTAPTCTAQGYTTYTCSKCGDSYVSDYKDTLGHDMQVVEGSAKAATCTEAGKEADKACSRCDYKETGAEIPANGHTRGNAVEENRVNATCTVNGSYDSVVYCTVCNAELSRDTITLTATGHDYTAVVTAPTCTEQGYTTYTCNQGDHTYVSDYKDALGHDMQVVEGSAVVPTCTVAGKEVDKACSRCDYKETGAEIPANGHTEVIDKAVAATCTETGLTEGKHCSVCNEVLVAQTETPALGHDMQVVEGSAVAPTCTVAGKEADKACSRCDYKETGAEIPANGHTEVIDEAVEATCTTTGLTEGKHCSVCGETLVAQTETPALGHDYVYAQLDADNHKVTCSRCDYSENKPHSFDENNTCKDCEYKKVTIDRSAYDDAVAEYQAIKTGDYTAKYTAESRKAYQTAVEKAIINDFTSQPAINAATSAILEAKTMLCLANVEIKVYVAKEDGTSNSVDTITRPYGTKVTINVADKLATNQMISKWTIETKESSVTTKLSTVESAIEIVATEPTDVYVHVVEPESTDVDPAVYSKVSFISKNGAVSSVEYVKKGETLNTDEVEGVKIPFYKFIGWSKASVTGTGEDIEVKAIYEFIEEEVNMCTVHYNGTSTKYAYDKFVYIYGAENDKLALSTTNDENGIITYLNENAFYAPHVDEIYVIEVDTQKASIGITGTYFLPASEPTAKKTFAFNCKMFLPEGCELVEAGAILKTATATKKAKAEKISARGEYTIKVTSSTAEYVEGKAYLTYKDKNDNLCTIYTDAQTITEA